MGEEIVTDKGTPRPEGMPNRPQASSVRKVSRVATNPSMQQRVIPPKPRYVLMAVILVLSVGLAATASLVSQRELQTSIVRANAEHLDKVRIAYEATRTRTQAQLRAHAQILVEDPRLKATLATENMNAATVDDILGDLSKLRGDGFFVVLSPEGRVFAEAGAKELRGLDLSSSSIVKRAQSEPKAAVGSWVLGNTVMDLSIMGIRYGENLIAYLVVGQPIGEPEAKSLSEQCGCQVATALGGKLDVSSTQDAEMKGLFERMGSEASTSRGRVMAAGGKDYIVGSFDLGDVMQSHRLMVAASVDQARASFHRLGWVLWAPPVLVLLAVLFALSANRSSRRTS